METQSMLELFKQQLRLVIRPIRKIKQSVKGLKYLGRGRHCPVCGWNFRKFGSAGITPRDDALCMHCGAVERHRLVWLYFINETDLFSRQNIKMLHVAPEAAFERRLRRRLGRNYVTADLYNLNVMVKMDIANIQYTDESFDVIYCSHVLEHVIDDKKAMREFFRVLKPEGWAILLVPIDSDKTFEDFSITDPVGRLANFGDETHVRRYGPDYIDRLKEAGFKVKVAIPADFLTPYEIAHMGITPDAGEIYFCTK